MALRYSKQREVIARNLKNRTDHPSADMVYASVREQMPHISLGTVYRNLKDMTACGEAISFMVNGKEHFDGRNTPHIHLCCSRCGSIVERLVIPVAMAERTASMGEFTATSTIGRPRQPSRQESPPAPESPKPRA